MFNLSQTTPTAGDCTAGYKISFEKECTLKEFVDSVLSLKGEWGYISISKSPSVEYRYGKLLAEIPEELMNCKVKGGNASGGWSRMDYYITVND